MRFSTVIVASVLLALGAVNSPVAGAEDEPGLILTTEQIGPQATFVDKRISRMPAAYIPVDAAPSPFTPNSPYKLTFEGDINMRLRDFLIFSAQGSGKLDLSINGKPVLQLTEKFAGQTSEATRLGKGKNHVVAVYTAPAGQAADLRLFWGTKTTPAEPIPPMVFTHAAGDAALQRSLQIREGRELVGQLRCTKCHAVGDVIAKSDPRKIMPELTMDAPSFENIGSRLNADWMASWISNPRSLRPTARMPRIFGDKDGIAPEARDIAAFLAAQVSPRDVAADDHGKVAAGALLFANLNCIACHIPPERKGDSDPANDARRIPLAYVKDKFIPGALKQFLLKPSAHYAWISMPNFRLSEAEAADLAAYLLSFDAKPVPPAGAGEAGNGMKLIYNSGCLNCHTLGGIRNASREAPMSTPLAAIASDKWSAGCMAADAVARKNAPDFSLTDAQRQAIAALSTAGIRSLAQDSPAEFAERQIVALRCTACHARDGRESLLATDLDAENQFLHNKYPNPPQGNGEGIAPDQRAPMLTWAGEKLRPEWMTKFIAGEIAYKPRYYLRARMPGFGIRADLLAQGLSEEHGCSPTYPLYAAPDKKLTDIGQNLVGKTPNQSFGCVQCHAINQQAALAPFEAPAINFMYVTSRLREDYYYRWIHNPLAVDPETKMPRFDDADGKTGVPVFDNDARKQFEAIWNYLLMAKDITPPAQ